MNEIYSSKKKYLPEIDGLRAMAVIAVIINHFDKNLLPGGFLGVDIFFVISGFVITSSLVSQKDNSIKQFLFNFYFRRIKRLYPALVLFILVMGILLSLFSPSPRDSLFTGISALFGFSNMHLLSMSTDYFAPAKELNGFLHTWSLGVEEQYYVLFPLILWFSGFCYPKQYPIFDDTTCSWSNYFPIIALTIVSIIFYLILNVTHHPNQAYYLMPARFWELGFGCLSFLSLNLINNFLQRFGRPFSLMGFIGMVICLFIPEKFIITSTIAMVLFTSTILITINSKSIICDFYKHPINVYLGKISYSLYLWHWGVFTIANYTIGVNLVVAPILFLILILFSAISYHYVEFPLRLYNWSKSKHITFSYALIGSLCALCVLYILSFPLYEKLYLANLLNLQKPKYLQITWWQNRKTGEYLETCHAQSNFSSQLLNKCFNCNSNDLCIYVIGDSHARNYIPAIKEEFSDNYSVHYLTMGHGCAFLPPDMASKVSKVNCSEYVEKISQYLLKNTKRGDIVFIGLKLFGKQRGSRYISFVKNFASDLDTKNVSVVLLDGTFPPELSPAECVDYPWTMINYKKGCFTTVDEVKNAYSDFDNVAQEASILLPNFYYVPLRTGLCFNNICGQKTSNGTPIWHDRGHITEEASRELAPLLHATLSKQKFYQNQNIHISRSTGLAEARR